MTNKFCHVVAMTIMYGYVITMTIMYGYVITMTIMYGYVVTMIFEARLCSKCNSVKGYILAMTLKVGS